MKQLITRAGRFWLPLLCIATLSSPASIRSFLYRQLYPLVSVEASQLAAPPDAQRRMGYRQDEPGDLSTFRAIAESIVRTARDDGERLRLLGDWLYALRHDDAPWILNGREQGLHPLLARLQSGERGLCGHNTLMLAAFWRSLGRDFRQIRFTTSDNVAWFAAHYGVEVYSPDRQHWMYYDVGLNGYAVDDSGTPLSLTDLGERLADGRDVGIVANPKYQDWNTETFLSFLRQHQQQVFSLNNELRTLDEDRRFGRLHFAYGILSKLPHPFDRVVDSLTGDGGPRLTLSNRPPPPSDRARLHLTAIPVG